MSDFFLLQMGDVLTEGVCFDTSLARGEWGMVGLAIAILRRSAWAILAMTAGVGRFSLLAVFVYVLKNTQPLMQACGRWRSRPE
jgi:hypothetical protein